MSRTCIVGAVLALLTGGVCQAASAALSAVHGAGVTGGHSSAIGSRARFAIAVTGLHGSITYTDPSDRISFRATRISLLRDESSPGLPTIAIGGRGTLDARTVSFYVRCIHSSDGADVSFFVAFRSLSPGWYWDGGGRLHSGSLILS